MSTTYPEYKYSSFPDQLDKQMEIRDPSASEIALVQQQNALISAGQKAAATELMIANPTLEEAQMNAEKLLRIHHSILTLQKFFYDEVQEKIYHIGKDKGDWTATMSSDAEGDADHLNMYDIVRYPIDGLKQYFMVIGNEIAAGTLPTDTNCYLQMSIKGDKGDTGYTPIKGVDYRDGVDGKDGASGLGFAPRGAWVNNVDYYEYDLVSHNGYLWYCDADNINSEPSNESPIWTILNISMQSAVGDTTPENLEDGGIWMHLQDDGHIILKTKNESGDYVPMQPETKASYVVDDAGTSLQRKIYQKYFDRDDVKVRLVDNDPIFTITASLLNNENVVIAKSTITDISDENTQYVEEFTCYDETGVYVMYKCKKQYVDNGDNTFDIIPEVII